MVHSHAFREYSGGPIVVPKRSKMCVDSRVESGERAVIVANQMLTTTGRGPIKQTHRSRYVWQPSNMCGNSVD